MEDKIKTILVDDEPLAIEALRSILNEIADIEIVAECANGFEAVKTIQEKDVDLVFLDIQMPKLDGFDVIELLGPDAPIVIFVTAYDDYAIQAFEAQALDYLMKPVRPPRLEKSVKRVREQLKIKAAQPLPALLNQHRRGQLPVSRILIRDGAQVTIVPVEDILYFQGRDDYVEIYTGKTSYLKHETLNHLEEIISPEQYCRIHRSYILNTNYLKEIQPVKKDSRVAVLRTGQTLPISRSGYVRLMELLA